MWEKLKKEFEQGKTLLGFSFLQVSGYVATMLIPLVVAKLFSKNLFGKYSLSEMIIFFFATLFITSPRIPFIYYANRERVETGGIRRSFSVQLVFWGAGFVFFSVICLFFAKFLMEFATLDRSELLFVMLAFFAISLKDLISNLFMAANEKIKSSFVEPSFGLLALLVLYGFYRADLVNLKSVFFTYFVSSVIVSLVCLKFVNFKIITPLVFDKKYFSQMLNFALWMVFGVMASYLINWGGVAILRKYASLGDTGVFNLAYKFFKGFLALIYVLPNYFFPHISESIKMPQKIRFYLYHKRPVVFLLGLACFAAAFFVIPYFMDLVYGDKFQDAVPIIRILLIGAVAFLYAVFYAPLMAAAERYKFVQVASVTQVVLNIILNLILIPRMGTYGAAIATVIAYIYLLLVYEVYFRLKLAEILLPKDSG